jgi:hypothetical protein
VDPSLSDATRELGTKNRPLVFANFGLGMSLTGGKSWHHIVPEVSSGLGVATDFVGKVDDGRFKFGTRFAFTWGAGIRWVPGGRWSVRGDINNRLYSLGYPTAFFSAPSGGTPLLNSSQPRSFWLNNPAITLGISRLY